ncbi:MAG: hypothetical protein WA708_19345 [Acidobacteriaceae bacterium]
MSGKGRMTVVMTDGRARTMDFNANDVGFVPKMDDDLWRDESIRLCLLEISRDFLKSVE